LSVDGLHATVIVVRVEAAFVSPDGDEGGAVSFAVAVVTGEPPVRAALPDTGAAGAGVAGAGGAGAGVAGAGAAGAGVAGAGAAGEVLARPAALADVGLVGAVVAGAGHSVVEATTTAFSERFPAASYASTEIL
jgi:hypothetical protein